MTDTKIITSLEIQSYSPHKIGKFNYILEKTILSFSLIKITEHTTSLLISTSIHLIIAVHCCIMCALCNFTFQCVSDQRCGRGEELSGNESRRTGGWEENEDSVGAVKQCYPISNNHYCQLCPCTCCIDHKVIGRAWHRTFSSLQGQNCTMLRRPGASSSYRGKLSGLSLIPISSDLQYIIKNQKLFLGFLFIWKDVYNWAYLFYIYANIDP